MKHVVKHHLSDELAEKATKRAWESYKERFAEYSPQATWQGHRHADVQFTVKGVKLKGTFDLEPGGIALDLEVPLLLRPFKAKAIDAIEREIQKWIAKAEAGELE